jgi:toxin FitB
VRRIIVDTDVASLLLKQRLPTTLAREITTAEYGITFVTYGELTRWSIMRQWGTTRRGALDAWLAVRPTLPYTNDVARIWGEITAHATRRGRPRPQNDTWIAATCLAYNVPLATLNTKDFSDYAEHEGLVLI